MNYILTPISYVDDTEQLSRTEDDLTAMIDNFVELVVFTPRGSFPGDPDFGFEYWNNEYSNVNYRDFNNGQNVAFDVGTERGEITRRECQQSVKRSLENYRVPLKQIDVALELRVVDEEKYKKTASKFQVFVCVTGQIDDGLGTSRPYRKEINFLMEPTVKR